MIRPHAGNYIGGGRPCVFAGGGGVSGSRGASSGGGRVAPVPIPVPAEQCPDDDCSQITQTIASLADEVEMRYEDLLIDRHGLYGLPNPHPDHGSWYGHVHKYLEVQRDLQFQIALAKSKGCPVDPNAEIWANEPPPSAPFSG
jgi:hypothetical protein